MAKVYYLCLETQDGTEVRLFPTRLRAKQHLDNYVHSYWGQVTDKPYPNTALEEAWHLFFDIAGGSWKIQSQEVDLGPPEADTAFLTAEELSFIIHALVNCPLDVLRIHPGESSEKVDKKIHQIVRKLEL